MPTPDFRLSNVSDATDLANSAQACPTPLLPSSDTQEQYDVAQPQNDLLDNLFSQSASRQANLAMDNNTGAGMAQSQEDSMYITPSATPEPHTIDHIMIDDIDKMDIVQDENVSIKVVNTAEANDSLTSGFRLSSPSPDTPILPEVGKEAHSTLQADQVMAGGRIEGGSYITQPGFDRSRLTPPASPIEIVPTPSQAKRRKSSMPTGIAKIDQELDWTTRTIPSDCSYKRKLAHYPSSLFQCESKYFGTQQSDRQIYNVNVRILTIDIEQASCTGYLLIKGLTPEHDTLQTYFTGEIIGGPKQKYSFRTKETDWGANDRTDLSHWGRFPAWRNLATHARQDLDFHYPVTGGNWWEQEHIFMRWKEHFLVPDHKTKSIAGASFEGFYYICLNQVEGKISGIYYHSKSEKYQQLELKHEGDAGIWHRGVTPAIEFR